MNNKFDNTVRSKKRVEVRSVHDEIIQKIIPNGELKNKNYGRYENNDFRPNRSLNSGGRYSRSGRHITSRFENLSIHESPNKKSPNHWKEDKVETENKTFHVKNRQSDLLFGEGDIEGRTMFPFKNERKQNSMIYKATEAIHKVPTTPKAVSRNSQPSSQTSKTPYGLRNKIKKVLLDEVVKLELDKLLEDSGSEYVPSSSDESGSETSNESDGIQPLEPEISKPITKTEETSIAPSRRSKKKPADYIFTSEEYFDRQYNKVITSNHSLNKLKTPRLAQSQLNALLKSLTPGHKQALKVLENEIETQFKRWLFSLNEGYNILLYGLGSKREILNKFHEKYLKRNFVIVLNGYFPDLALNEMLDYICVDMLGLSNSPSQAPEAIEMISAKLKSKCSPRIFLLFNNIDGPMMRTDKAQTLVSQLAQIPKIHIVATVDHINSPLLWDQKKMSSFNFIWEDATVFAPYVEETSFESSLMVQRSGGLALTALKNVYQSLTTNSRKVFKLLLKHQLENEDKKYTGMHFSELYRECRAKFIVSSDLALRTLLTEFLDHELVKWKKDTDQLIISIDTNVLKQFQIEMDT